MNGLSGNRLSICLLRFRIPAKNFLLTSAVTRWIETLGEMILNLSGQIDLLLPSKPLIICLIYFTRLNNAYQLHVR